ncbi:MAG TPA: hypothetical protein VGF61_04470 [Candidatus Acidoferrum sp.]
MQKGHKYLNSEIGRFQSAEYGPVPLELVLEYVKALQEIGVLEEVKWDSGFVSSESRCTACNLMVTQTVC